MKKSKNIYRLFFLFLLFSGISISQVNAQENNEITDDIKFVENNLLKLSIISPAIIYERGIKPNFSISGEIRLRFPMFQSSSTFSSLPNIYAQYLGSMFDFGLQGRYYYNMETRYDDGLNTQFNSANYVGAHVRYSPFRSAESDPLIDDLFLGPRLEIVWGFQRSIKRFYVNPEFGLNFNLSFNLDGMGFGLGVWPIIGLRTGFILWGD